MQIVEQTYICLEICDYYVGIQFSGERAVCALPIFFLQVSCAFVRMQQKKEVSRMQTQSKGEIECVKGGRLCDDETHITVFTIHIQLERSHDIWCSKYNEDELQRQ